MKFTLTQSHRAALVAALVATLLAPSVMADEVVPEALRAAALKKRKDGHKGKLTVGATGSANSSSNVVGAADGTSVQIGILVQGSSKLTSGQHTIETEGRLQHAQTRTPVLPVFVKSTDVLEGQSTWMYSLASIPWIGPFARLKLSTQAFSSEDVRPGDVTVEREAVDGTKTTEQVTAETPTPTTSFFEPLILNQTAGMFANPISRKKLTLKAKLGAGAQQIIARDGYAVASFDDKTKTVKLRQLETSLQAGGEFELQAEGAISDNTSWTAKANFFQPLYSNATRKLSGLDALQTDVSAALSVKLSSWAKLDYVLNVRRIPLVLEEWQVQHGLMLTTGFNLL